MKFEVGKRYLINKNATVEEIIILEVSPSGKHIRFTAPNGVHETWKHVSMVEILEELDGDERQARKDEEEEVPEIIHALRRYAQRNGLELRVSGSESPVAELVNVWVEPRGGSRWQARCAVGSSPIKVMTNLAGYIVDMKLVHQVHHRQPPRYLPVFTGLEAP